ncbi:MAG: PAS domain S-box protein, partial [Methanoregula sp.]|nr:PAS domain S-box protein [Methanoregula sp.]
ITEQKRAGETEQKLTEFRESVITNARVWLSVLDHRGKILMWNTAAEEISGYRAEEVIGKNEIWKLLYPKKEYRNHITDTINRIIRDQKYLENFETTILSKQGNEKVISWNTKGIPDATGRISDYIAIGVDVTDRQLAERMLRESEEKYREFFTTSRDCVFITTPDGQWIEFNDVALEMFGFASREELSKVPIPQLYENPSERTAFLNLIIQQGYAKEFPVRLRRKDGAVIDTLITTVPVKNPDGSTRALVGTIRDITERKRAEEEIHLLNATLEQRVRDRTQELEQATETIRASLDEKIVLLREIHHRVKNNLQILISLLNLQSRTINDPQIKEALKESTQRILAMSMVHEKLYSGSDLAHIDFISYLSSLAKSQVDFYRLGPAKVTLEITGENIMLDINTAIPMGLVMNELLSNALKHAFPGDRKGTIRIDARETEGRLDISLADDGVGLPEGFDYATSPSLGLRLVHILIEQLSGTIELKKERGTTFNIVVKEKR